MRERVAGRTVVGMSSMSPDVQAEIEERGYVVFPNAIDRETVQLVREQLAPYLQGRLMGRNEFEGTRTERVYSLLAKAPVVAQLVEHEYVLAVADHFLAPSYLLSAALVVNLHPGESPQEFHQDDALGAPAPPRPPQGVSTIWAIDEFTSTNGATDVIPGSHRWTFPWPDRAEQERQSVPLELAPGSVAVFPGTLFHRSGANRSDGMRLGMTIQYCQPWLRQLENLMLATPPELAAQYSERIQAMVGYSLVEGTFVGYVDGRHPKKLIPDRN